MLGTYYDITKTIQGVEFPAGFIYILDGDYNRGKGREIVITHAEGYIRDTWGDKCYFPAKWEAHEFIKGQWKNAEYLYDNKEVLKVSIQAIMTYLHNFAPQFCEYISNSFLEQYNYLINKWNEEDVDLAELLYNTILDSDELWLKKTSPDYINPENSIFLEDVIGLLLEFCKADENLILDNIVENILITKSF